MALLRSCLGMGGRLGGPRGTAVPGTLSEYSVRSFGVETSRSSEIKGVYLLFFGELDTCGITWGSEGWEVWDAGRRGASSAV